MNRPISIFALTEMGNTLAMRLLTNIPKATVLFKPKPFSKAVERAFLSGHGLIMICAAGIALRSLAPVINNKRSDPPVLLLDELGEFVVPILSGHEGGANAWGLEVAQWLSAQLVITTANTYLKPVYTVGMGCERHCSEAELRQLLNKCLVMAGLTIEQVDSINSIDIKADELGLVHLAKSLCLPFHTYDKRVLGTVEHRLSIKSDYVFSVVGVYGVAESAALVAADNKSKPNAELVLAKTKSTKATCAIARNYVQ